MTLIMHCHSKDKCPWDPMGMDMHVGIVPSWVLGPGQAAFSQLVHLMNLMLGRFYLEEVVQAIDHRASTI